jgi:hypothetical protein
MSETGTPHPPTIVRPDEGKAGSLGPVGVVFKLWDEDTQRLGGRLIHLPSVFCSRWPNATTSVLLEHVYRTVY